MALLLVIMVPMVRIREGPSVAGTPRAIMDLMVRTKAAPNIVAEPRVIMAQMGHIRALVDKFVAFFAKYVKKDLQCVAR